MNVHDLTSVYTFAPFSSKPHEDFVVKEWEEYKQWYVKNMIFVGNCTLEEALPSLLYRYPVYYGKPQTAFYSQARLRRLFDPAKIKSVNPSIRYVWGGPVVLCDKSRNPESQDTYVLHTWGVNLESQTTDDYATYVNKRDGRLKRGLYTKTTKAMVKHILDASMTAKNTATVAHVVMPQVGLGAFLRALTHFEDQEFAKNVLVNLLEDMVPAYPALRVHYCVYASGEDGTQRPNTKVNPKPNLTVWHGNGKKRDNHGDMFHVLNALSKVKVLIGVNAWDPKSFVGNGMVRDPTIDGMMVAGGGAGRVWKNSSFLHNPLLIFS